MTDNPVAPPSGRSSRPLLVGAVCVAVLIAVAVGALVWWPSEAPAPLAGSEVEAQIREGLPADYAHCPAEVPRREGKIVDCVALSSRGSAPVVVRVTQDDEEGHFSYAPTRQKALGDPQICQDLVADVNAALEPFRDLLDKSVAAAPAEKDKLYEQIGLANGPASAAYRGYKAAGCPDEKLSVSSLVLSVLRG